MKHSLDIRVSIPTQSDGKNDVRDLQQEFRTLPYNQRRIIKLLRKLRNNLPFWDEVITSCPIALLSCILSEYEEFLNGLSLTSLKIHQTALQYLQECCKDELARSRRKLGMAIVERTIAVKASRHSITPDWNTMLHNASANKENSVEI